MDLEQRLRTYAMSRGELVSQHDADLIVSRTLARGPRRPPWVRHGFNAGAAIALSLIFLFGGVALGMQLHSLRLSSSNPRTGPLPVVPNEILNLDNQVSSDLISVRLRDRKLLTPQPRWMLARGTALMIDSGSLCDVTWIHVVDLGSPPRDRQPPVSLPGCYQSPTIVPNSTRILLDHAVSANGRIQDAGTVAYDWFAGRIVKTYPSLQQGFEGGLVSADGTRFYTILSDAQGNSLDIIDLTGGTILAHVDVQIFGFNGGGIALSPDGQTLCLNEGIRLRLFDASTGKPGPVLDFKDPTSRTAMLPGWLWSWLPGSVDADAKEGFEIGHGVAVDSEGRWVAALGVDDSPEWQGIWVFDATSGHLLRHIPAPSESTHFRGLAFSLDGSVLYALRIETRQIFIDVIDPQTGRFRALLDNQLGGAAGIARVDPGS